MASDKKDICSRLLPYDTPALCNALERLDLRPRNAGFTDLSIHNVIPVGTIAGIAVTARLESRNKGDNGIPMSRLYSSIANAQGPVVVVVRDDDDPPGCGALLGEVVGTFLRAIGCTGFVTNGCVRDAQEVRELGISTYAAGLCVSHAYVRITAVDEPVVVGGLEVRTGDLLHGDRHGLLSIPWGAAPKLPEIADEIRAGEQASVAWAKSPDFTIPALLARRPPQH